MKINEVEKIVGITKRNIRFYENQGLLLPCRNSGNGYRDYSDEDVKLLTEIKLYRKLSMPIEEIHRIKAGALTVQDALKRHLIKLERESINLEKTRQLCAQMAETTQQIDAEKYLAQIGAMESKGAQFVDISRDIKQKSFSAVVSACVVIAFMGAVCGFLLWGLLLGEIPVILGLLLVAIPAAVIAGVALALKQRIQEIKGGEENAAAKY